MYMYKVIYTLALVYKLKMLINTDISIVQYDFFLGN